MKYNNYNISIFGYQDPDFIPKSDGDSSCSEEYTYLVLNITQTELGHKSTRQVKCDSQFAECDSQSEPNQAHYVMVGHLKKKLIGDILAVCIIIWKRTISPQDFIDSF